MLHMLLSFMYIYADQFYKAEVFYDLRVFMSYRQALRTLRHLTDKGR